MLSRRFGEWLSKRLHLLRNWRSIVDSVASVLKDTIPGVEVYVFGSVVEGRVTGASDIDLLVVIPENYSELETHLTLSRILEDRLGDKTHIIDLHVIRRSKLAKPPYKWWLKKSHKIL